MIYQGIDNLDFKSIKNKKTGVITNFSATDIKFRHILDIFATEGINVKKVFTPEHGLYGDLDGKAIENSRHPKYGYPIISLYSDKKAPSKEDFDDLDIVIYDIQDVGLRFFTYINTLYYTMETASKMGIEFLVLDRINPLGRKISGGRISKDMSSFVGDHFLPIRYGLTTGELAMYYKKLYNMDINLKISKISGWHGEEFHKIGLVWNMPSPNLPTFSSLLAYTGMVFLEGTNLSHGRGTTKPFELIGAPWIDPYDLYDYLKEKHPEIDFRMRSFIPFYREYAGKICHGLEFFPKPSDDYLSVALDLLRYFKKYDEFETNDHLDRLAGIEDFINNLSEMNTGAPEDYRDFIEDIILYR